MKLAVILNTKGGSYDAVSKKKNGVLYRGGICNRSILGLCGRSPCGGKRQGDHDCRAGDQGQKGNDAQSAMGRRYARRRAGAAKNRRRDEQEIWTQYPTVLHSGFEHAGYDGEEQQRTDGGPAGGKRSGTRAR